MAFLTGSFYGDNSNREKWVFRASVVILSALYLFITLPYLGFARDDWNHYASIRNLHQTLGDGEALRQITTNQWFGAHELRIFFLSFITHFFVSKITIAQQLIYFIQLSMHAAAATLFGSIILNKFKSLKLSLTIFVVLMFAPAVSQNTFWINNLFFVQPWFLYALATWLAIVPKIPQLIRLGLVTTVALICAFSGEGTIPLLLITLAGLPFIWVKKRSPARHVVQSLLPAAIVTSSLLAYVLIVMVKPPKSTLYYENILQFPKYLTQFAYQGLEISRFNSEYYGFAQIAPSPMVYVAALSVGGLLTFVFLRQNKVANETIKSHIHTRAVLLGILALVASFIPQLIGVLTGSRPGPELRYLYVPVQVLVIVLAVIIWTLFIRSSTFYKRIVGLSTILISTYLVGLTSYNSSVIWNQQAKIDDKIWSQLDRNEVSKQWAIVTYHPLHPYLMAPYHSNAVSDFQADWGIAGRMQWIYPSRPRVQVFRDAQLNKTGELVFRNYYDDNQNCSISKKEKIQKPVLFMIFDYGKTFKDLSASPLLITSDFAQFNQMRNQINSKYSTTEFFNKNDTAKSCSK